MTQYSFPWNDVNGDRLYDADDFMRFFAAFLKTGVVMSFKDGLRVRSAQNGMNIQVGGGSAVIGGGSYLNDENIAIQVNVASSVQNRTDSVVLRMDKNARDTYLYYKPSDTTVVRNDILFELQLATISVKMNATQITDADITDMRSDPTVCGWATPFDNINVDGIVDQYKSIFEQADSDFKSWFQNLKNQLDDNQAANLQNQINNSIHDGGQISVGTDLDLFINPGFYAASGRIPDTELINYPEGIKLSGSGTIYAQIVVFKNASSSMVKQVFYDQQSADEYTRSYANNTWQPWQKVKTNKGDTPWEDVEVMNGFTSGTFPLQYRIYNGNIYLRGRINTVTTKAGVMVQFGKIPITISNQHEWYGGVISTTNQVRMILAPTGALTLVATADMGNNFQISGFDTNFLID